MKGGFEGVHMSMALGFYSQGRDASYFIIPENVTPNTVIGVPVLSERKMTEIEGICLVSYMSFNRKTLFMKLSTRRAMHHILLKLQW